MLKGSIVALITPFKDDNLDESSYRKLIDYHIKMELMALFLVVQLVVSTLSHNEHKNY